MCVHGVSCAHPANFQSNLSQGDDLIGTTVIDLEDRWFDKRWKNLGHELREDNSADPSKASRWDVKPIEHRSLYTASMGSNPQGNIEMWLELCTPGEDSFYPPADITLPPAVMAEARLVLWKAKVWQPVAFTLSHAHTRIDAHI